jgi:hypothetical protein
MTKLGRRLHSHELHFFASPDPLRLITTTTCNSRAHDAAAAWPALVAMVFGVFRSGSGSSPSLSPHEANAKRRRTPSLANFTSARSAVSHHSDKPTMEDAELERLNADLRNLAEIFPDVRPEVFREMLGTFSEESRLHIVAEQLVKHNVQWVNGRRRTSVEKTTSGIMKEVFEVNQVTDDAPPTHELVPMEETFRSYTYQRAVRAALSQEFRSLSRSTIEGVLAEQNYSYTLSRPILLGLAAKSWRISLSSLLSKWKRSNNPTNNNHYMLVWPKTTFAGAAALPTLRPSGSAELDKELDVTVLQPLIVQRQEAQDLISVELASLLNEQEAEAVGAIYECEVCFSEATFEAMATCTSGTHVICFRCIQQSVSEALYGQSWELNIDHHRSQLACIAPSADPCEGCIPHNLTHRAVVQTRGGNKTWAKLQSRLAEDALRATGARFVRCPFCAYAEIDDLYLPPGMLQFRLEDRQPGMTFALILLIILLVLPFFPQYLFLSLTGLFPLPRPNRLFGHAIRALVQRTHLSSRFVCPNPSCARASCRKCKQAWRDPHTCFESATLSLRTTVEAARTAALKRTCPQCGLGFVKESGCNKMVCVCGYSMCYICRQGLGRKPPRSGPADNPPDDPPPARHGWPLRVGRLVFGEPEERNMAAGNVDAEVEEGEGYRHFCQHFRPAGGRCTECEKCDLYRSEDEDEIVRRAGMRAEKEWRKMQRAEKREGAVEARTDELAWAQKGADWVVGQILRC